MRFLSLLLCPMLALNPIWAQTNSARSNEPSPESPLHVHVVDDPGSAPTLSTSTKGYVMQVTDSSGAPVTGAAVALRLPEDGPTGRFANGLRAWVAYSDAAGIARFPVIEWGENAGRVDMRVTAAKGSNHAGLVIPQQLAAEHRSVSVVSVPMESLVPAPAPAIAVAKPTPPQQPQIALPNLQPGTLPQALADTIPLNKTPLPTPPLDLSMNVSKSGSSAPPMTGHTLVPNPPPANKENPADAEPTVTITNSPTGAGGSHDSHSKKWLVLVAVGAGAGVGAMMALKGHGSSGSSASSTGVSVGAPTITIGH